MHSIELFFNFIQIMLVIGLIIGFYGLYRSATADIPNLEEEAHEYCKNKGFVSMDKYRLSIWGDTLKSIECTDDRRRKFTIEGRG